MKKIIIVMCVVLLVGIMTGCSAGYTSSEPCAWCNNTPTKKIESDTEDTEAYYYCEECSTTCFGCGEAATQHYTNLLGAEVFVCDDCGY